MTQWDGKQCYISCFPGEALCPHSPLCPAVPTLLGMFVVAEGTMKWGFARVHVHLSVHSVCQFEEVTLTPVFPLFLLDWAFPMGEPASSSELIRCFWPWIWLVLDGDHSAVCAGQVLCHLIQVWHCSWWPQPEHCGNICWDIWDWMKECSEAPNYFPGGLFLYGNILIYCSWVGTHLAVFSAWNTPVSFLSFSVLLRESMGSSSSQGHCRAVGLCHPSTLSQEEQGDAWDPACTSQTPPSLLLTYPTGGARGS